MPIQVLIPTPLQQFTANEAVVELNAVDVNQLIQVLDERFPGFKARLCDDSGKLRRFLNIYVNSEDIRFLDNQATPLREGDEVSIIPAVAGGSLSPNCT